MFKKITAIPDKDVIKIYDETPLWSAPFGLTLLNTIKYKKNINILDIGSGCGFPMLEVAMRFGNTCNIFGIDTWKPGVKTIEEKISVLKLTNTHIIKGNAENLPFKDNFFRLIISNNGLNNVDDIEKVLSECYRTLKSGGQFVFTFNLPDTMYEFYDIFKKVLRDKNMKTEIKKVDEHIKRKRKTTSEMSELLSKYKFTVNSSACCSFDYKFNDAESMLNYFTIREYFLPPWLQILKEKDREKIFSEISKRLNKKYRTVRLTIPYACFNCEK
jgi:ubiquinone/menaquinone biosynthesis C-methylase UbiE